MVLGPALARRNLGGAGSWGLILAAESIGAVLGAALMIRQRPRRLLYAASLAVPMLALPLLALAAGLPVVVVAFTALLAGVGGEVFEINWSTALQEQIPSQMLSRVAAYDALGSVALAPIGTTLAGPVALALGIGTTLTGAAIVILASSLVVLCVSEVRTLTRHIPAAPGPDALAG